MFIVNAKQSTLAFKLDNGELMKVKPGEVSKQFVPSLFQLQSIIAFGNPTEVAIVLSSSYEMDLLRQLNGSLAYLKNSVQAAKDELLNGKVLEETPVNVNVEAEKLKEQLADKDKEVKILQDKVKELESKLASSPAEELQSKLSAAQEEVTKANADANELRAKIDTLNAEITDRDKKLSEVTAESKTLAYQLTEANNKLAASVSSDSAELEAIKAKLAEAEKHITELEAASQYAVSKSDYDDAVAKLEAANKEIEQLKADGKTIVDKYNQAKSTLTSVMEKFGITYNGTEFVFANTQE